MKKRYPLGALGLIALATLLFYGIESYRGEAAWKQYVAAQKGAGFDPSVPASYPKPVSPENDFAESPLVRQLLFSGSPEAFKKLEIKADSSKRPPFLKEETTFAAGRLPDAKGLAEAYGKETLSEAIAPLLPTLDEIALYAKREGLNHPNREISAVNGFPHVAGLGRLVRSQNLRVLANLAEGNSAASFDAIHTALDLHRHLQPTPVILSWMLEAAYFPRIANDIWIGLATHLWNEEQLAQLQGRLEKINLVDQLWLSFRNERSLVVPLFSDPRIIPDHFPKGWAMQNLKSYHTTLDTTLFAALDPKERTISPKKVADLHSLLTEKPWRPYFFLAERLMRQNMDSLELIFKRAALAETALHFSIIGCALERYRLAHGAYPETLAALVPRYCRTLPREVVADGDLVYKVQPDGGYLLYSLGWNGKDDGGVLAFNEKEAPDPDRGDWIWKMPSSVTWGE